MMSRLLIIVQTILATAFLTSCATVFTGTSQIVNLQAVDQDSETLEDINCVIRDGEGAIWAVSSNPGAVNIPKGNSPLMPECKKDGYTQKTFAVGDSFNAATIANVLFWPGFIVDAMTGSMSKYPSHITVLLEQKGIENSAKRTDELPAEGKTFGPDGRVAYSILCSKDSKSWNDCYTTAGNICKSKGYDVISRVPEHDEDLDAEKMRAILISCR